MNPPAKSLATQDRWNREALVEALVDYLTHIEPAERLAAVHMWLDRYVDRRKQRNPEVDAETLADERDILLGRVLWAVAVWQQTQDGGRVDAAWKRDLRHFIGKVAGNA